MTVLRVKKWLAALVVTVVVATVSIILSSAPTMALKPVSFELPASCVTLVSQHQCEKDLTDLVQSLTTQTVTVTVSPTISPSKTTVVPPKTTKPIKVKPNLATAVPTTTILKRLPGPTVTDTVYRYRYNTAYVTLPRQTVTKYATVVYPRMTVTDVRVMTRTATTTQSVTVTATDTDDNIITITPQRAVGVSIALVLGGVGLAVLLIWAAFALGWLRGDGGNRRFLREVTMDLKHDK